MQKKAKASGKRGSISWLRWAQKIQAIAQNGLAYCTDLFDRERYEQLRALALEIFEEHSGADPVYIEKLFSQETGYATPKVDIRVVVFNDDKVLLVREKDTGLWTLPGGWADIGLSPSEVAVKEAKEESGYEVKPAKLIAIYDKKCHPHPPSNYYTYEILIQSQLLGGTPSPGLETKAVGFFAENELPPLSLERVTASQLAEAFRHLRKPHRPTAFD